MDPYWCICCCSSWEIISIWRFTWFFFQCSFIRNEVLLKGVNGIFLQQLLYVVFVIMWTLFRLVALLALVACFDLIARSCLLHCSLDLALNLFWFRDFRPMTSIGKLQAWALNMTFCPAASVMAQLESIEFNDDKISSWSALNSSSKQKQAAVVQKAQIW